MHSQDEKKEDVFSLEYFKNSIEGLRKYLTDSAEPSVGQSLAILTKRRALVSAAIAQIEAQQSRREILNILINLKEANGKVPSEVAAESNKSMVGKLFMKMATGAGRLDEILEDRIDHLQGICDQIQQKEQQQKKKAHAQAVHKKVEPTLPDQQAGDVPLQVVKRTGRHGSRG
jgi:hypothetical protein